MGDPTGHRRHDKSHILCLARNYRAARMIGDVPIRIILIDHLNPIWMLIDREVLVVMRPLPMGLGNNNFTRFN
jgi:hypothetical protein